MQSESPMNTLGMLDRLPQQAAGSAGRTQKVNNTQAGLQRASYCCCGCRCSCDRLARPAATAAWLDGNDRLRCDCREREKSTEQHTVVSGEWLDGASQQIFCSDSSNKQSSVADARSAASKEVRKQGTLQTSLSHGQARLGQAQCDKDLQHSTRMDGRSCCCSAHRASSVNKHSQTNLQQKNSQQQGSAVDG